MILQPSKASSRNQYIINFFSLLANPKGYDAIASICANAHKNFSIEREHISRTNFYIEKSIYITKNHLQKGKQL